MTGISHGSCTKWRLGFFQRKCGSLGIFIIMGNGIL